MDSANIMNIFVIQIFNLQIFHDCLVYYIPIVKMSFIISKANQVQPALNVVIT